MSQHRLEACATGVADEVPLALGGTSWARGLCVPRAECLSQHGLEACATGVADEVPLALGERLEAGAAVT